MCRELVAKFLNMFKKFYANVFSKIFRKTVVRRSCECRELVAANCLRINNAKFSRHSYECRASVVRRSRDSLEIILRLSGEKIKLSDIRTNVVRHCKDCRATVVRMKISYVRGNVVTRRAVSDY